ncbi:MAG: hypothetical protein ACRED9_15450, partial [Caulobacteraceae bacterium]
DAYLMDFVESYNRTRLRCLGYHAPLEALNNLTGHNTFAGVSGWGGGCGRVSLSAHHLHK